MRTKLVETNGIALEVIEHDAIPRQASAGAANEVDRFALLLHGFPESAYSWRYQAPLLAELGYRVWAPNLRGYGRSSRPERTVDYSLKELVGDVEGLIDAAGAKKTLLVGHDWGGAIAWMLALQRARPLDGLVVMNLPHPDLFRKRMLRFPQLLRSWYAIFFQLPWLPEMALGAADSWGIEQVFRSTGAVIDEEAIQRYRRLAAEPGAVRAMVNYYRAAVSVPLDSDQKRALESRLETPTLLIWGENDVALGKELTYGTEERVSDLTLRYLPGVSHWVQQEAPEEVNRILVEWLHRQR